MGMNPVESVAGKFDVHEAKGHSIMKNRNPTSASQEAVDFL